jgi:drug/metabolite transporter (DMT)-like permease
MEQRKNMNWLIFALMTVACWGLYGIYLHAGQVEMKDPELGRYKAFLFVGIAYFLTAVVAPLVVLLMSKNMSWSMPPKGMWLSLLAGILGAIGAFCVLLAMGAGAKSGMSPPIVAVSVMSIIFAGAPIVNAVVAIAKHPPEGGFKAIALPFVLGILLAALGGFLVTKFKPMPGKAKAPPTAEAGKPE